MCDCRSGLIAVPAIICEVANGLLLDGDPSQGSAAWQVPVVYVQAVLERVLNLLDWQEPEDGDDRSFNQKLMNNTTDADTLLVRDPPGTLSCRRTTSLSFSSAIPVAAARPAGDVTKLSASWKPRPAPLATLWEQ